MSLLPTGTISILDIRNRISGAGQLGMDDYYARRISGVNSSWWTTWGLGSARGRGWIVSAQTGVGTRNVGTYEGTEVINKSTTQNGVYQATVTLTREKWVRYEAIDGGNFPVHRYYYIGYSFANNDSRGGGFTNNPTVSVTVAERVDIRIINSNSLTFYV